MEFNVRTIGRNIIQLSVSNNSGLLHEDISDMHGKVPEDFIESLEHIVEYLKEHNEILE